MPARAAAGWSWCASPAPPHVKAAVAAAVDQRGVPLAKLDDFTTSMRTALWWQVAVFTLALILSARLPSARPDADGPMIGGA
jgi:hypothetical protein